MYNLKRGVFCSYWLQYFINIIKVKLADSVLQIHYVFTDVFPLQRGIFGERLMWDTKVLWHWDCSERFGPVMLSLILFVVNLPTYSPSWRIIPNSQSGVPLCFCTLSLWAQWIIRCTPWRSTLWERGFSCIWYFFRAIAEWSYNIATAHFLESKLEPSKNHAQMVLLQPCSCRTPYEAYRHRLRMS